MLYHYVKKELVCTIIFTLRVLVYTPLMSKFFCENRVKRYKIRELL